MSDLRVGRIVCFLTDIKSEAIVAGTEGKLIGGCGYLAAIRYLDNAINLLLTQQTQIEHLENRVRLTEESEKDARDVIEDIFGDREVDTIVDELKEKLKKYVKDLLNEETE